jgi:hypothetical protein
LKGARSEWLLITPDIAYGHITGQSKHEFSHDFPFAKVRQLLARAINLADGKE